MDEGKFFRGLAKVGTINDGRRIMRKHSPDEPQPDQSSRLLTPKELLVAGDRGYKEFSKDMNRMTLADRVRTEIAKAQLAKDEARIEALIEDIARFLANNTDMNCQDSVGIKLPEKLWHAAHNEYGRDSAYRRILVALKANPTSEVEG